MSWILAIFLAIVWPAIVAIMAYRRGHTDGCIDAYRLLMRDHAR